MKKLLIFLILPLFYSCDSTVSQESINNSRKTYVDEYIKPSIYSVEYQGHEYIILSEHSKYGVGSSIMHSPNCKCNNQIRN